MDRSGFRGIDPYREIVHDTIPGEMPVLPENGIIEEIFGKNAIIGFFNLFSYGFNPPIMGRQPVIPCNAT